MQMEDKYFEHLLAIEPSTVELTKQDYEKRMGIKQQWEASQKGADVGEPMGKDTKKKDDPPLQGNPKTRQDFIRVLQGRGFEYKDLKTKKLPELKEMI